MKRKKLQEEKVEASARKGGCWKIAKLENKAAHFYGPLTQKTETTFLGVLDMFPKLVGCRMSWQRDVYLLFIGGFIKVEAGWCHAKQQDG